MQVEIKVRCEDWLKLAAQMCADHEGLSLNQFVIKVLTEVTDKPLIGRPRELRKSGGAQ